MTSGQPRLPRALTSLAHCAVCKILVSQRLIGAAPPRGVKGQQARQQVHRRLARRSKPAWHSAHSMGWTDSAQAGGRLDDSLRARMEADLLRG